MIKVTVCLHIYIYIYIYTCILQYIYIYIYTIHVFNLFLIYITDCFFLSDVHVILKINTYIMCSACHYVVVNLVKKFQ